MHLFELRVVERSPAGAAPAQLRARGYAEKYRGRALRVANAGGVGSLQRREVHDMGVEAHDLLVMHVITGLARADS